MCMFPDTYNSHDINIHSGVLVGQVLSSSTYQLNGLE